MAGVYTTYTLPHHLHPVDRATLTLVFVVPVLLLLILLILFDVVP